MLQDSRAHSSNLHSRESMNTNATNNPKQKKKTRPAEVSLNEWVYSPYFIVIDCETTGLDPSIGRSSSNCLPSRSVYLWHLIFLPPDGCCDAIDANVAHLDIHIPWLKRWWLNLLFWIISILLTRPGSSASGYAAEVAARFATRWKCRLCDVFLCSATARDCLVQFHANPAGPGEARARRKRTQEAKRHKVKK